MFFIKSYRKIAMNAGKFTRDHNVGPNLGWDSQYSPANRV